MLDPADANAIQEVNLAYENVKEVDGLDVSKDGSEAWEGAIKRFVRLKPMIHSSTLVDQQMLQLLFNKC